MDENEPSALPVATSHRPINPGRGKLERIAAQTGSCLGDDNIIRIEDVFDRT